MDYHITPSGVLLYIQDSVAAFLASYKLAAFDVKKDNILWVITDYNIRMTVEKPYWPNDVTVEMWVSEKTPLRCYFDFRLKDQGGNAFAIGTSCWSMIDATTHHPIPCIDYLGEIEVIPEMVFGKHSKAVFPAPESLIDEYSYQTRMVDVDFNSHISNRAYLATALGGIDLDYERTHTPVRMYLKFMKETFLGDTLTCRRYACKDSDSTFCYEIFNSADQEVCHIWIEWAEQELKPFEVIEHQYYRL